MLQETGRREERKEIKEFKEKIYQLEEVLLRERELIISQDFKNYRELLAQKEEMVNALLQHFSLLDREEKEGLEDWGRRFRQLQELNRRNTRLLHSYRAYQKSLVSFLGLEESAGGGTAYGSKNGGSQAAGLILNGIL